MCLHKPSNEDQAGHIPRDRALQTPELATSGSITEDILLELRCFEVKAHSRAGNKPLWNLLVVWVLMAQEQHHNLEKAAMVSGCEKNQLHLRLSATKENLESGLCVHPIVLALCNTVSDLL